MPILVPPSRAKEVPSNASPLRLRAFAWDRARLIAARGVAIRGNEAHQGEAEAREQQVGSHVGYAGSDGPGPVSFKYSPPAAQGRGFCQRFARRRVIPAGMKPTPSGGEPVLRRLDLAFAVIIVLTWLVELIRLPALLYDEPSKFLWSRVLLRTVVMLAIWAWMHFTTKRLLQRLHRLEKFLLVCSWCRKVGHEGEWLTMEDYFGSRFDTSTSHGVCPECSQRLLAGLSTATRVQRPAG